MYILYHGQRVWWQLCSRCVGRRRRRYSSTSWALTSLLTGCMCVLRAGVCEGQAVAVKIFLPGSSPDGSTLEEIAITCSNSHHNLTRVLAVVVDEGQAGSSSSSGPLELEAIKGLVMVLVQGTPMADRPTSQHLLRCK